MELFGEAGLEAGVVAVGVGAEFVNAAESLVEGLRIGVRSETAGADGLIAVQADLKRLVQAARADITDANSAVRAQLLLDAEVVLVVIRRFERACGEGSEVDCERAGRCAGGDSGAGGAPALKSD